VLDRPLLTEIADGAAADAGGVDPGLLDDFLPRLVVSVATGRRLDEAALHRFRDAGRRAADRGVAPRALVDLYLSAAWRLWRHLPEVAAADADPAGVVRGGEVMLRSVDDAVAVLIEGFQLARRDLVRSQAAARREFVDDLLIGGTQALPGLVHRAGMFGLSLVGPQAVVVVRAEREFTDTSPLTTLLERAIQGGSADADALVTTKDGLLVVVFAAPDRAAIDEVIAVLPSDPGEPVNLRRIAAVGSWRMGVGRPHPGPGGVRLSYEQAREALELGARLGNKARVLDAADLLMHRVLVRDREAMLDLIDAVLAPLQSARGGAELMLQTLEAYFTAGGNASSAARSLHLSVRALTYRLARIAELTGRDPADPAQRFELQSAVAGARLLGWPDAL
jgi:sugar diacid utilization regulator